MKLKTMISMVGLACSMSASGRVVYEAHFNDAAGLKISAVGASVGTPFSGDVDRFGAVDGKGSLVWNNMTRPHQSAYGPLTKRYTMKDSVVLRLEACISDFDFSPENKFGAQVRFALADGPNGVYMALHIGGPGQLLQLRSRGYEQNEVGREESMAFSRLSKLTMKNAKFSSLDIRLDVHLAANTYDVYLRKDASEWIQVGDNLPLGMGGEGDLFYEIDRVRVGTGGRFKEGSSISIDSISVEEVPGLERAKPLGLICMSDHF